MKKFIRSSFYSITTIDFHRHLLVLKKIVTNPTEIVLMEIYTTTATGSGKIDENYISLFKGRTEPYTYSWLKKWQNTFTL
jgi:hypothetical protein